MLCRNREPTTNSATKRSYRSPTSRRIPHTSHRCARLTEVHFAEVRAIVNELVDPTICDLVRIGDKTALGWCLALVVLRGASQYFASGGGVSLQSSNAFRSELCTRYALKTWKNRDFVKKRESERASLSETHVPQKCGMESTNTKRRLRSGLLRSPRSIPRTRRNF